MRLYKAIIIGIVILTQAIFAGAQDLSYQDVTVGKVVSIKGETLFMPPLGMVQLWGVRLPAEIVPADREQAINAVNRWVHGVPARVFIHQRLRDAVVVEVVTKDANLNANLIREGYATRVTDGTFRPPFSGSGQVTATVRSDEALPSGERSDAPSFKPIFSDETVDPPTGDVQVRDIPIQAPPKSDGPLGSGSRQPPDAPPAGNRSQVEPPPVTLIQSESPQGETTTASGPPSVTRIKGKSAEMPQPKTPVTVSTINLMPDERVEDSYDAYSDWPTANSADQSEPEAPEPASPAQFKSTSEATPTRSAVEAPTGSTVDEQFQFHYSRARELHQADDLKGARAAYLQALEAKPGDQTAMYYLSQTYQSKEDISDAEEFSRAKKGSAVKPGDVQFRERTQPDPEPAAPQTAPPAENSDNQLAESHFKQGMSLQKEGKMEAARAEYMKALEYRPGYPQAQYRLSQTYANDAPPEPTHDPQPVADPPAVEPTPEPAAPTNDPPAPDPTPEPATPANDPPAQPEPDSAPAVETIHQDNPAAKAMTASEIKDTFHKAFLDDNLSGMRGLVKDYPGSMASLFNSYMDAASGTSGSQARMMSKQADIIARLFITEHGDESFMERVKAQ